MPNYYICTKKIVQTLLKQDQITNDINMKTHKKMTISKQITKFLNHNHKTIEFLILLHQKMFCIHIINLKCEQNNNNFFYSRRIFSSCIKKILLLFCCQCRRTA